MQSDSGTKAIAFFSIHFFRCWETVFGMSNQIKITFDQLCCCFYYPHLFTCTIILSRLLVKIMEDYRCCSCEGNYVLLSSFSCIHGYKANYLSQLNIFHPISNSSLLFVIFLQIFHNLNKGLVLNRVLQSSMLTGWLLICI